MLDRIFGLGKKSIMKQIIIVSRCRDEEEFVELFEKDWNPPKGNQTSEMCLTILNGMKLNTNNVAKAKEIFDFIADDLEEVLVVIHGWDGLSDFRTHFGNIAGNLNYQIKDYSSRDNIYNEFKTAVGSVEEDPSYIKKIYDMFSIDHVFEAKLELLQKIVAGEEMNFEGELSAYKPLTEDLNTLKNDFFDVIESKEEFSKFRDAYDNLYDDLKIEDHIN